MNDPLVNLSAERAVLGAMLFGPIEADKVIDEVSEMAVFTTPEHREVFEAMLELRQANEALDVVTLQNALKLRGTLDTVVGGVSAIGGLLREVHTAANLDSYIGIVQDRARARNVFSLAQKLTALDKGQPSDDLIAQAREIADRIGDDGVDGFTPNPITQSEVEGYIDAAPTTGVPIHWQPMRQAFGRLDANGELVVVGARPSKGKTGWSLAWALEELRGGTPVGLLSLEKRRRQVLMRFVARMARIDLAKLTHGQNQTGVPLTKFERRAASEAAKQLAALPLHLLTLQEIGTPTPTRVIRAGKYLARKGAKLVFVDQLYRVVFPDMAKAFGLRYGQVLGQFARRLQMEVAWKHEICVCLLHQLNRDVEKSDDPPKLSSLRDAGELEQDADRVLFIHRPDEVDANAFTNSEFIVAKSSDGWKGSFRAFFAAACGSFFTSKNDEGKTFYAPTDTDLDDRYPDQGDAF
jgi:replicative DNA helicase